MLRRLASLTVVAAAIPAVALAATPTYDLWQGTAGTASVNIVRQQGKKSASAGISYQCKDADGMVQSFSTQLTGKSHGKRLKLKGTADGAKGTATLKATLGKRMAKGSFKVSYPFGDDAGTVCKVAKKFKLKHSTTTGG